MNAVRDLLVLLRATEPEPSPLGSIETRADGGAGGTETGASTVTLRDVVDAQHIVRVMDITLRGKTRYDDVAELRVWRSADPDHSRTSIPIELASEILRAPSSVDQDDIRVQLERAGLLGAALLAAFTCRGDLVDRAADHECAVVRIAAATNPFATQRSYRLSSDPCRDVALAALANRSAQEHMTYQFRDAVVVADGFPLDHCACGLGRR
jgi:hypothetical protein